MNEIETYFGVIETTADALRIFQLCREGRLGRVRRRLHDKERLLIRSGSVFVFDEQESGIRRWTDGRLWSPSRILGNFLIYRELEKKSPPVQLNAPMGNIEMNNRLNLSSASSDSSLEDANYAMNGSHSASALLMRRKRVKSTSASFASSCFPPGSSGPSQTLKRFHFKENGLIKKTISVTIAGHVHHLICYYNKKDFFTGSIYAADGSVVVSGNNPSGAALFTGIDLSLVTIPADLLVNQNFRKPGPDEIHKRSSLLEDDPESPFKGDFLDDDFGSSSFVFEDTTPSAAQTSKIMNSATALNNISAAAAASRGSLFAAGCGVQSNASSMTLSEPSPSYTRQFRHSAAGNSCKDVGAANVGYSGASFDDSIISASAPKRILLSGSVGSSASLMNPQSAASTYAFAGGAGLLSGPLNFPNSGTLFATPGAPLNNFFAPEDTFGQFYSTFESESLPSCDIESEFGHIAATLSKLSPKTSAADLGGGLISAGGQKPASTVPLPPITGETFVGQLPPLYLMNEDSQLPLHAAAADNAAYYKSLELFSHTAKLSNALVNTPAAGESVLSMPMFPSPVMAQMQTADVQDLNAHHKLSNVYDSTAPYAVSEASIEKVYEEKLKNALFGSSDACMPEMNSLPEGRGRGREGEDASAVGSY